MEKGVKEIEKKRPPPAVQCREFLKLLLLKSKRPIKVGDQKVKKVKENIKKEKKKVF